MGSEMCIRDSFYTVDEDMWAMPFNCSTPVVYYNKTVFDAAGVTEFPTTFEGITEAAQQVAESNSSITPVGMYAYGYALDQMVINMGGYVINNENGRADRATEVAYQDQIIQIYNWIKDLQDQGLLLNYGSDGTNTISGFTADQLLNSNVNSITAGPLLSQLPQLRTDLQTALEAVFNGSDVESAVAQAVESTNSAIASANQGVAE